MNYEATKAAAQREATKHGIRIAVGYQTNDTTGEREYGYCPEQAVGPAFVDEVLEVVGPVRIRVTRASTGTEFFRGSAWAFLHANEFDAEGIGEILDEIEADGFALIGGGAAPGYNVEFEQ